MYSCEKNLKETRYKNNKTVLSSEWIKSIVKIKRLIMKEKVFKKL